MKSLFMYLGALHHCRLLCTVCCCLVTGHVVQCCAVHWVMTHYGHAYASRALFMIQLVGPKYASHVHICVQVITRDANIQLNSWNTYTIVNLTAGFDGLVVIENGTRTLSVLGEGFQTFDFAAYNNELFIGGHPQLSSVQVQYVFTLQYTGPCLFICTYIQTCWCVCLCGECMMTIPTGLTMCIVLAL